MPAYPRAATPSAIDASSSTSSAVALRATGGIARVGADRAGAVASRTRSHAATPRCCSTPQPHSPSVGVAGQCPPTPLFVAVDRTLVVGIIDDLIARLHFWGCGHGPAPAPRSGDVP